MIKLGKDETVKSSANGMGRAMFKLYADSDLELEQFWQQNKHPLDTPRFDINQYYPSAKRSLLESLVYRYNMFEASQSNQHQKQQYLEHFSIEAITAVIYATDYCPDDMTLVQYAGAVKAAFEEYSDTVLFDDRMINLALTEKTPQKMIIVSNQIALFKQLLTVNTDDRDEE